MQLRWRIFLVSLLLIVLAVSTTATVVHGIVFSDRLEELTDNAVQDHANMDSVLQNRAAYERLSVDVPMLDSARLTTVAALAVNSRFSARAGNLCAAMITTDKLTLAEFGENIDPSLFADIGEMEYGRGYTCKYKDGEQYRIAVGSRIKLSEGDIFVYSLYNINDAFESYSSNIVFIWLAGIGLSLAISLILFIITSRLLRPLSRMNTTLRRIAGGEYGERVAENCSAVEMREIAYSVNSMADAVEESIEKLEGVAAGRKRYVDSLAHEMKTPLTSILCFGDLLRIKRSVSDSERIEYAGIIVDEAKRMKSLSSKLLELACADSAELDMERTSVKEILEEAITVIAPPLEARGISIAYSGDDGYIICDRELFKSLIYNLCDNAAKASKQGQSVQVRSRAAENGMVISVSDKGIGMTKDVLKKVTEPFYMADKSRSRKAGGAGLGLSLCVEIAKRHRARLSAKSRPGAGTSIFITVPYADEGKSL